MPDLTDRQQAVYDYLVKRIDAEGIPPSVAEIAQAFHIHGNAAHKHLRTLDAKGAITLLPGKARGIRLPAAKAKSRSTDLLTLPILGRVAAGAPIGADADYQGQQVFDRATFFPRPDYLLRVKGDSMRDDGILDGDLIAVHRTPDALDGQIVVARIEDEITVKRLRTEMDRVLLLPENPDFPPIVVDARAGSFAIEGVCVGTIRRI
jgi:repressor LexA